MVHQKRKERIDRIGNDQGNNTRAARMPLLPAAFVFIPQLFNGLLYPLTEFLPYALAVQSPGHRAQGNTGFPGHVNHRRRSVILRQNRFTPLHIFVK